MADNRSFRERLDSDGYFIAANLVPRGFTDEIFGVLISLYNKFAPPIGFARATGRDRGEVELDDKLIALRKQNPEVFAQFYDSSHLGLCLWRLTTQREITDLVCAYFGCSVGSLNLTGVQLRMDMPGDSRNRLGWHQDRSYHPQNSAGHNGCVVWIPLQTETPEIGPPELCVGSPSAGFVEVPANERGPMLSTQFEVPDAIVQPYPRAALTLDLGDVAFMNMNLIHRSGINRSKQCRLTVVGRYHNLLADDFRPGKFRYHLSDYGPNS